MVAIKGLDCIDLKWSKRWLKEDLGDISLGNISMKNGSGD